MIRQDKCHVRHTICLCIAHLHHTNDCMSPILPKNSSKLLYEVYQICKWCKYFLLYWKIGVLCYSLAESCMIRDSICLNQKVFYYVIHFWHIVGAILKEISLSETIKWCWTMHQKTSIFHYSVPGEWWRWWVLTLDRITLPVNCCCVHKEIPCTYYFFIPFPLFMTFFPCLFILL